MKKICFLFLVILFWFNFEFPPIKAQECGRRINSGFQALVFGGEIAKQAEWPWNVAMIHRQEGNFFCGGTLISAKHVLSAAHCFQSKGFKEPLSPFLVQALLGKFNLSVENETGSESSLVWEIVIHPDWKYEQFAYDADLSIVVLERKVTLNIFIQPICLPEQSDDYVTGTGTVVGWGKSENSVGFYSTVPSKLDIPAINDSMCYTTFPKLAEYSSTRTFCGGFINLTKSPCVGDSGGGFYFPNQDEDFWTVRGIVSGSIKTIEYGCDMNKFALFTHVAKFADWITKVMIDTLIVNWKFVVFECRELYNEGSTECFPTFKRPMTRNMKIRAYFSALISKNPIDVTDLWIDFSPSTHILSGIGEEFPNLRQLVVHGYSIKFVERQSFANLTQLDWLGISRTSIDFLPNDLLADLPNLTLFGINQCNQLENLPEDIFMNQQKLKTLYMFGNGLAILQKDLFKNNLKLESLHLNENKLKEISVDFTRLPAVNWIELKENRCIDQEWRWIVETVQSFQNKININCQPLGGA